MRCTEQNVHRKLLPIKTFTAWIVDLLELFRYNKQTFSPWNLNLNENPHFFNKRLKRLDVSLRQYHWKIPVLAEACTRSRETFIAILALRSFLPRSCGNDLSELTPAWPWKVWVRDWWRPSYIYTKESIWWIRKIHIRLCFVYFIIDTRRCVSVEFSLREHFLMPGAH